MKKAMSVLSILIIFPIRFYLMWYVLTSINATELPMFLFWVSFPLAIIIGVVTELIKE